MYSGSSAVERKGEVSSYASGVATWPLGTTGNRRFVLVGLHLGRKSVLVAETSALVIEESTLMGGCRLVGI